jgi:regulator of RNase E activity RraA
MDDMVQRAGKLDTATLSDAMDRLGINGQCAGIAPRDLGFRMAGRAFTLLYGPAAIPAGTVGDFVDDVAPGSVVVLDNRGRTDATVWGDILTEIAHRRGIAGTAIDGICRDVHLCVSLKYPIFSRGHWMRTGKDRVQVEAVNGPVSLGGVRVQPGDLLRGDADGVVVLPKAHEERIIAAAEEIQAAEDAIRSAIRGGARLADARKAAGYHSLQAKRP